MYLTPCLDPGGDRGLKNSEFTVYLLGKDYSGLSDSNGNGSAMDEFWVAAANCGEVWLKQLNEREHRYDYLPGVVGSEESYHVDAVDLGRFDGSLPVDMKIENFADDPYRGILYFCRGLGWDKPTGEDSAEGLPFLEFYWAEEIQDAILDGEVRLDLSRYDLADLKSYTDAVRAISKWMAQLPAETPIGSSGYNAKQMGQLKLSEGEFEKAFSVLVDASEPEDGKPTKTLKPKDSDEADAEGIGELPKPG